MPLTLSRIMVFSTKTPRLRAKRISFSGTGPVVVNWDLRPGERLATEEPVMRRHLIAAAILFTPLCTSANSAVQCRAELPATRIGHWSWRDVDGKRCWYRGPPGMEKSRLQWPQSAAPHASRDSDVEKALLESVWPKLEAAPFEERWPR